MRIRSYIFNFSTIALFVAFALIPLLWMEEKVLPYYSMMQAHLNFSVKILKNAKSQSVILLGDSTMRAIHRSEELALSDPQVLNLALPGSEGSENLEMLKLALSIHPNVQAVIYGSFRPLNMSRWANTLERYTPLILDYSEIFSRVVRAQYSPWEGMRLAIRKRVGLINAGDSLLEAHVFRRFGNFLPIFNRINTYRSGAPPLGDHGLGFENNPIDEMLKITHERGIKLILLLPPYSSKGRTESDFKKQLGIFQKLCTLPLECWNFSDKMDDSNFQNDGFHLSEEKEGIFREFFSQRVKKLNLSRYP